jgi:hypothetical protein
VGDAMGEGLEQMENHNTQKMCTAQQKDYYRIYEQVYETPDITGSHIAVNTGMTEDFVVKVMEEMYENHVMFPPYLAMNPTSTYAEYLHFLEVGSVDPVLPRLKRCPFVISYRRCEGAWNILVSAFQLSYFNDVAVDFCIPLYQGKRGVTVTPKCAGAGSFEITGTKGEKKNVPEQSIEWNEKGWTLYRIFGENMRRAVQPVLKEHKISYEAYVRWRKDVDRYCSTHVTYYPLGFYKYVHRFFLMETDSGITSLFDKWPCSCIFIEVNSYVLAHISVPADEEEKLLRLSEWLQDDLEITGFCADPLYKVQAERSANGENPKRRCHL